jgi:hypothetical protein
LASILDYPCLVIRIDDKVDECLRSRLRIAERRTDERSMTPFLLGLTVWLILAFLLGPLLVAMVEEPPSEERA